MSTDLSPELSEILKPPKPSGLLGEIAGLCQEAEADPESAEKEQVDREVAEHHGGPGETTIEGAIPLHFE